MTCSPSRWTARWVAGLRDGVTQHHGATPRPVWNPDIDRPISFYDNWTRVPAQQVFDNAFKMQWETFLRHVVKDEPWQYSLLEGAKGVQLAEKGLKKLGQARLGRRA